MSSNLKHLHSCNVGDWQNDDDKDIKDVQTAIGCGSSLPASEDVIELRETETWGQTRAQYSVRRLCSDEQRTVRVRTYLYNYDVDLLKMSRVLLETCRGF